MKKHILVLGILLVALLFVFVPQAHAGVGNTHSGGSSTIHSGGGGGGSSWSGGGSSVVKACSFPLLLCWAGH